MARKSRGDGPFWLDGIGGYDAAEVREEMRLSSGDPNLGEDEDYFDRHFHRLGVIIAALAGAGWAVSQL